MVVYLKDNVITDVQGDETHPISRGRLCAKGTAFIQDLTSTRRITIPAIRNRVFGSFETSQNWSRTIDAVAEKLRKVKDRHPPESLIIGCDPEAGLDFYLGARRFARLWGTPNVFHPFEDPHHHPSIPLKTPLNDCTQWPESPCIVLIEADLAVTHPVAFGWILEAQQKGAKIIAADTRFTTTLSKADLALMIRPNSGNLLGLYITKSLLEERLYHQDAADANLTEVSSWKDSFEKLSWEDAVSLTGVSQGQVIHLSRLIQKNGPTTVITGKSLARLNHYGIWLALATAMNWLSVGGGGWYPVESGLPPFNIDSDIEDVVGNPDSSIPFLTPYSLSEDQGSQISQDADFRILISSGDCLQTFLTPLQNHLKKLDFTVHFGAYPNQTAQMANAVIPPSVWAERDGLWITNDRAIQWAPHVVAPRDACCSGLHFWMSLAQRLGWEEHFPWQKKNGNADHFQFYQWLLKRQKQTAGCDLSALKSNGGLQFWPQDDAPLIKNESPVFTTKDGKLEPVGIPENFETILKTELTDEFPLSFQSSTMVSRSGDSSNWWSWTEELEDREAVQVHPDTAAVLGIENGDPVIVAGPRQSLEGQAWISRMVSRTMVWAPQFLDEKFVLIHKKEQSPEDARNILKELLQNE
jgi:anaerobic selenocysteine-containing dehydrogenase